MTTLFAMVTVGTLGQQPWQHGPLQPTPDGHYLQHADGTPFFWLGDTGWELFHRLSYPEISDYLHNRAAKGFNVIQAVALAEFDGLRIPNRSGHLPLTDLDPSRPNPAYFSLIDSTLDLAEKLGLYIGLLPTWGDKVFPLWGIGPQVFDSVNAFTYGKWLGERYRNRPNIIWIIGGDRPAVHDSGDYRPVWRQMARGIRAGVNGPALMTYHPSGGPNGSSAWLHNEAWLDVNMFQSGHGGGRDWPTWEMVTKDRTLQPVRPTLDGEPNYEDHPVSPWPKWHPDSGYFNDYDVRKQAWRSVLAGACGVTYGHHAIWQFMSEREQGITYVDRGWRNALERPGAGQMKYLREWMETWGNTTKIPDNSLVTQGQATGAGLLQAMRSADYSRIMVYIPTGRTLTLITGPMPGRQLQWQWLNPRDGSRLPATRLAKKPFLTLETPAGQPNDDWVLLLESLR